MDKSAVYTVFREACYDEDPAETWDHRSRLSRAALPPEPKQRRLEFATHMLSLSHTPAWYYKNIVWCDLCTSILPRTRRKAQDMALARKGGKGWMRARSAFSAMQQRRASG